MWLTDLHLDAAKDERINTFFQELIEQNPDAILIGGDISNGVNFLVYLKKLTKLFQRSLYFVLGNHDFYYSSITKIRQMARRACDEWKQIHYLTGSGVVELTPGTALIGHDGWADGRAGNFLDSTIILHDYLLIDELKNLTPAERQKVLNRLGNEAAEELRSVLLKALEDYERVLVLTHPPPFRESCMYKGKVCDENWAPHFVCQSIGDMLKEVLVHFPTKQVLVLCGHSHHTADQSPLPNLRVLTGHCELGHPSRQGMIDIL
ncbi:MAG: metallophosphoesterase [Waddliaceae bacterium]